MTVSVRDYDGKVASASRDLEGLVCDLANMVELAVAYQEDVLRPDTVTAGEVRMFNSQAELAMFAIYKVSHMARDLKDKYYAAISAEAADA